MQLVTEKEKGHDLKPPEYGTCSCSITKMILNESTHISVVKHFGPNMLMYFISVKDLHCILQSIIERSDAHEKQQ